ncbi:DNA recombination protein RmuC [Ostreibacterium oceani]|uniref:DNA recombination protein RmuC n=1 Tax=Ostreibacterium oceani TaxID=2654998 RepID=A0A6N7F1Y9_9GAMM|nr:DNA recombination protein RmuC [Ostreibacterium oceani]MPV86808.1 DNA recombination protein RmuC [Ostreibacterium oceani]
MNLPQFGDWIQQHPIESTILLLLSLLTLLALLVYLGLRRLHQKAAANIEIEKQNQQLISQLSQAFEQRMQHQSHTMNQYHQQLRQEHEHTKSAIDQRFQSLSQGLYTHQQQSHKNQQTTFFQLQQSITEQLKNQTEQVRHNVERLNQTTENRLKDISNRVNAQLEQGFTKTQATFTDIQKRLSIIDTAQKRIDDLSHNVVSLQDVLTDKKSRGTFGEMQLQTIVENVLPPQFVDFQYTLSNNKRADCIIHLPEPSGDMVIDAKFPLDAYKQLIKSPNDDLVIGQQFKRAIKKHIDDIADKYILPPQTGDSAILFIPAEAIFAEIHAYHQDIVEYAQRKQIWLTSPTTLMAVLATAKSVIKDDATRKQAHILREQLYTLRTDFDRFQKRMDNLAKHIDQANRDVQEVNTSANKISHHFKKIEATDEWDINVTQTTDKETTS